MLMPSIFGNDFMDDLYSHRGERPHRLLRQT